MADHPDSPTESVAAPVRRPRVRQRLRTPQEARQWRRRLAGYVLAAVSFVLVVNALVGENGYLAMMRARHEYAVQTETLRRLRQDNLEMKDQIQRLKADPAALEDAARELRLSKPGETMIVIKDAPKAPNAKTPPAPGR